RAAPTETAAKFYWPNVDAVGATGKLGGSPFEVVGVIGDVKNDGIGKPPEPELYFLGITIAWQNMQFVVHTKRPVESVVPEIRAAIQKFDPELPIQNVSTMRDGRRDALALEIVSSALTGFFALAALLLSALGVYGVMAYSVRQRTVEFGTRMAMGATQRSVFELVTGAGLKMAAIGIGLGLAGAFAIMPVLRSVYGVGDSPPFEFIGVIVLVSAVAIAASAIPAWRATLVPPMAALRDEPEGFWNALRRSVKRFAASREDKETAAISEQSLAEDLTAASRNAKTFDDAINKAVDALRDAMQAKSAILLKRDGDLLRGESLQIPANGFLTGRLRFLAMPLPMHQGDFETWQRWAEAAKPDYTSEIRSLHASGATLAIALRAKNEISGVVLLKGRDKFHFEERAIASRAAGQLALLIENAGLTSRIVEQEKLRKDVELATEVQRRLLPAQAPQTPMAQLAGLSIPARGVGGDYYDFIDYGDHKLGIAIADIAGKGVAAALIMSVVQATLRIVSSEEGIALPDLAARMNRLLHRSTQAKSYATFFYAQIDKETNQLRYVNAGHNPPYLWRGENGEIVELPAGGTPIGLFPQMRYEEASVGLQKGDVLIAFTDGVTEAMNPSDEEFGEDRLKALLGDVAKLPIDEMSARIAAEMRGWIREAEQYDDLTFVLMKVN
ncbi:MAG: FtsX-like permease family protein, partial [Acidobacteria bacterium]|nr:FtsX-like permease family protein [Acidobacteriota bacterium]